MSDYYCLPHLPVINIIIIVIIIIIIIIIIVIVVKCRWLQFLLLHFWLSEQVYRKACYCLIREEIHLWWRVFLPVEHKQFIQSKTKKT